MRDLLDTLRTRLLLPAYVAIIAVAQLVRPFVGIDRAEAFARRALRWLSNILTGPRRG